MVAVRSEVDELIKIFAANGDNEDTLRLDLDSFLDDFGADEYGAGYDAGWSEGYDEGGFAARSEE